MSVDWNAFSNELDNIVNDAANRTDERLAERISSVTRMTAEEIHELFPAPADKQKLAKLLAIVKSAEESNVKINKIMGNAEELGGIVLSLLGKFA